MAETTRNSRLSSYKNTALGTSDLRRKRAELSVSLRKQAREEQLFKRRAMSPEASDALPDEKIHTPEEIVAGLKSQDLLVKTQSARAARRMLSREQNPPINLMVNAGVIKPLVDALTRDECSDLQFEAAWALTNIASGTHENTMAVVDSGAIPHLVTLVAQGGSVGEQSAWCLGNIAGDGAASRDAVLKAGILPALLPLLKLPAPGTVTNTELTTAAWTYSNLCRNKNPLVDFDLVAPALPYISDLLECEDHNVLADACWALSYLTDGPNDRIEGVQKTEHLLTRLVKLLGHRAANVKTPALRALGNMLTGDDNQTDRCLDAGCIDKLCTLARTGSASLVKEAAWAVSNIFAGTPAQIERALLPPEKLLVPLIGVLSSHDPKCQKEAAWAITNLCLGGTAEQLNVLLGAGALEPYCALLASRDYRTAAVVLDGISHLLQAAAKYGQVEALCMKLEEIGALDKLEALQHHENEQIYKKTVTLIDTYFSEAEDQIAHPSQTEEEYQFGTTQPDQIDF